MPDSDKLPNIVGKKKRRSPVERRQMAVMLTISAFTAICQQRRIFCKNQNQGQDYSAKPQTKFCSPHACGPAILDG
jgi:hypothetical protein